MKETDIRLSDGRTLHVYDAGADEVAPTLAIFWQHGSPQTGLPPEPLLSVAAQHGIRWLSHDRAGYGGSTPLPGRDVASVVADVSEVADSLGIARFAVMGASGGGPHALACAALLPNRVLGAVCVAGMAPYDAAGLDWFGGMATSAATELRLAVEGRAALRAHLAAGVDDDPEMFAPADLAAFSGAYGAWFATTAQQALTGRPDGYLDDNVAAVTRWGFEPGDVRAPVLFVHGGQDRLVPSAHSEWLAGHCRSSELWLRPDDGHLSIFDHSEPALTWLREHVAHR